MVIIPQDQDSDNLLEKIAQFEKYATLLMSRFDVKILFDGSQAFTDGKEIHLPNLLALTPKEIDFLYGILLHEVGHILFSQFEGLEKKFEKIETMNQLMLVNAIEDARIENKMLATYGGAKEIFDTLYNKYASDKKYMAKIFKTHEGSTDWWFEFCCLIHNEICQVDIDAKKMIGKNLPKLEPLVKKVQRIIKNHPLKDNADSFDLALAIHAAIFKQKVDHSPKTDFAAREKAKREAEKLIQQQLDEYNKILEENKDLLKKLRELRRDRRDLGKQRSQFYDANKQVYNESDKLQELANKVDELQDKLSDAEYDKQLAQERMQSIQEKEKEKAQKLSDKEQRLKELEKKLQEAKTQSQKDRVQKSIDAQKRMQESLKKQIEQAQAEEAHQQSEAQKAQQEAQKAQQEAAKNGLQGMDAQQIRQEAWKKIQQLEQESQNKFGNKIGDKSDQIRNLEEQFNQAQESFQQQLGEKIKAIDAKLKAMGMEGMGLIPEFKENPDWKQSDNAQQSFDQRATKETGQPVVNGCGAYGTDVRSMTTTLQDVSSKLQEINLAEVFEKESHKSMIECVNEVDSQTTNTRTDEGGETFVSTRRHIPMTTKFDVVREEINANNIAEINEIRKIRAKEIAKVTEVLKAKFKFKQKPKFRSAREEGSLCPRDLYQIPQGLSTQIFEELYKKPDSKVRVAIAIDISGSMDKEEMGHGRKLKELAVVLSDSLAAANVKHEVLGYGAPVCPDMQDAKGSKLYNRTIHNLETIVYRNLGGASGLGNIELQPWDNSDGESLRVVAKRMGKEKSKKKVIFVVSDSKPFLTDSDVACLDQDLRNAIKEAKAQGIEVVGIGWNKQGKEFYGDKYCDMKDEFDSLVKFLGEKIQPVR